MTDAVLASSRMGRSRLTAESARTVVCPPWIQLTGRTGARVARNAVTLSSAEVSRDLARILDFARRPTTLAAIAAKFGADEADVRPFFLDLPERSILAPARHADASHRSFFGNPASPAFSQRALSPASLLAGEAPDAAWGVMGAMIDDGTTGTPGARFGPLEIRSFCSFPTPSRYLWDHESGRIVDRRLPLVDLGDVTHVAGEPAAHVLARIEALAGLALDGGLRPLLLGGDHGATLGVVRALAQRIPRFGIVHLDAHTDRADKFGGVCNHSNVFSYALDHRALVSLVQIGVRQADPLHTNAPPKVDRRVKVVSAPEARRLGARVLDAVPRDLPLYVSVDIDVLDPAEAPNTGTPVPGGMTTRELSAILDALAQRRSLLGLDLMEVSMAPGTNVTARAAAWLLWRAVLALSEANRTALASPWLAPATKRRARRARART